jgi:murein DD-endopeptidase MepM/ murein hydrolase activator NlpD
VNGGSTQLVNAHRMTLTGKRFWAYRGQSDGVDLVRLNGWGLHASGPLPPEPGAYVIFGDSVFAPCAGTVIAAVDGLPDMPPPTMDRQHMAGNHVLIERGEAWLLVGNLRSGSVRVRTGERVQAGDLLGAVGNSGNTAEPHLHIHAQRPGTSAAPFSGEPLPITFEGRFLARNARIGRT